VRPNENIERAVAALSNRIGSPVMTDVKMSVDLEGLKPEEGTAVNRMYPKDVVDLFAGEQLVIVGRYKKSGAAKIKITGKAGDNQQTFDFPANFVEHSDDQSQAFIEKLWAVRRVGEILDEIDLKGKNDELVKELVSLSLKHGIMTPYTSFLADENAQRHNTTLSLGAASTRLESFDRSAEGQYGFDQRAAKHEYQDALQPAAAAPAQFGGGGAASGFGGGRGRAAGSYIGGTTVNGGNGVISGTAMQSENFYSAVSGAKDDVAKVAQNVRQIGNKAFYRRSDRWVDSAVTPEKEKQTVKLKRFSPEYFELVDKYGREAAKYLASDEPVTVELGGKVYEVSD
jgi:Ca-activated chloride channel family protein